MNTPENYQEYRKLMSDLQITKKQYIQVVDLRQKALKEYKENSKKAEELRKKLLNLIPNPIG
jgi:hypothetical protein